jgi:hypothetical protein
MEVLLAASSEIAVVQSAAAEAGPIKAAAIEVSPTQVPPAWSATVKSPWSIL